MDDELLGCPFCGTTRVFIEEDQDSKGNQVFFAECGGCGARSGGGCPKSEAVAAWNRRAGRSPRGSQDNFPPI